MVFRYIENHCRGRAHQVCWKETVFLNSSVTAFAPAVLIPSLEQISPKKEIPSCDECGICPSWIPVQIPLVFLSSWVFVDFAHAFLRLCLTAMSSGFPSVFPTTPGISSVVSYIPAWKIYWDTIRPEDREQLTFFYPDKQNSIPLLHLDYWKRWKRQTEGSTLPQIEFCGGFRSVLDYVFLWANADAKWSIFCYGICHAWTPNWQSYVPQAIKWYKKKKNAKLYVISQVLWPSFLLESNFEFIFQENWAFPRLINEGLRTCFHLLLLYGFIKFPMLWEIFGYIPFRSSIVVKSGVESMTWSQCIVINYVALYVSNPMNGDPSTSTT